MFLKIRITVKSVIELKDLEDALNGVLMLDTDVISVPDLARKLSLTPAAMLVACRAFTARDRRYGVATGLDGTHLLFRVPVAALQKRPMLWRIVSSTRPGTHIRARSVRTVVAYRACLRHHMNVLRNALLTVDGHVRSVLERASACDSEEVRKSQARQVVQLRYDLSRLSLHEAHLQQRLMVFDQHLDDLATSGFVHECPLPIPLPQALLGASKEAQIARGDNRELLYLSTQAVKLSPQAMEEQLDLALGELAAIAELKRSIRHDVRSIIRS